MKIEVWSDYNCPFCYIGKVTLEKALAELKLSDKVEIIYKAYQLDPNAPKMSRKNTFEVLAEKYDISQEEAKGMMQNVVNKAASVGLTYHYDIVKTTNTFDAHRLLKMADKTKVKALNTALYEGYFTLGLNLSDYDVLKRFGENYGFNRTELNAMLHSDKFRADVLSDIAEAKALNIRGVPYFRINKKFVIPGVQPLESFVDIIRNAYVTEMGK